MISALSSGIANERYGERLAREQWEALGPARKERGQEGS